MSERAPWFEALDDLRDLGDIITGWSRPMSDTERLAAIQQWWRDKGEPILQAAFRAWTAEVCGWANGRLDCSVPGCKFDAERCILVQRQRGMPPAEAGNSQKEPSDA